MLVISTLLVILECSVDFVINIFSCNSVWLDLLVGGGTVRRMILADIVVIWAVVVFLQLLIGRPVVSIHFGSGRVWFFSLCFPHSFREKETYFDQRTRKRGTISGGFWFWCDILTRSLFSASIFTSSRSLDSHVVVKAEEPPTTVQIQEDNISNDVTLPTLPQLPPSGVDSADSDPKDFTETDAQDSSSNNIDGESGESPKEEDLSSSTTTILQVCSPDGWP